VKKTGSPTFGGHQRLPLSLLGRPPNNKIGNYALITTNSLTGKDNNIPSFSSSTEQQQVTQGWQVRGESSTIPRKKNSRIFLGSGKTTNNKAEILAVYMGLKLAQERNIQTLTVLGDSEIVIKELRGRSSSPKGPLKGICSAINSLKKNFISLSFFHILRNQNSEADNLAKAAKNLEQSHLLTNQTPSYVWLP
jgi:ribonuclease HI